MPPSQPPRSSLNAERQRYRGVSLRLLWRHGQAQDKWLLLGGWLLSLFACIGLGLATVIYQWSGLPLEFGGVQVYITVYPPLLICLWWTLCVGWLWGAVPAYLSTLTLAFYAGMPAPWALVFACANPLGFAVLTQSYRAIAMPLHMRSSQSILFYVLLSFVASIFSSSGALIWSYTNQIDRTALLPIWQGWWLGGFLQSVVLVGPLLFATWPRVVRWRSQRSHLRQAESQDVRKLSLQLILWVVTAVLLYGVATLWLGTQVGEKALQSEDAALLHTALHTMLATTWVFYWVSALIIVFLGFFGYRMFTHWSDANETLLTELAKINGELRLAARTDMLTGLLNRRAMEESLAQQVQRSSRFAETAALMILDIDHFKQVNDRFGHDAGDAVIRALSQAITQSTRGVDNAGRWGGEEFLLLLPSVDATGAMAFAERLREQVAQSSVTTSSGVVRYSISLGVALLDNTDTDYEPWLKRADQALYQAKAQGRNRTVLWS